MTGTETDREDAVPGALLRQTDGPAEGVFGAGRLRLANVADLPIQLDVRVPVRDFRVSDLLSLAPGAVVASAWPGSEDLPLSCGDVRLLWTEFEVVDQVLAVRVTRLV
jgi:flagellar motor switch protein FliN/FliY